MVQPNFDKFLMDTPFIANSKLKPKALYEFTHAITDNEKTIVRKRKKALLEKIKNGTINPAAGENNFSTDKLSSEDLEKRIISALNNQPNNANLLGKAIDFFIKVKGKTDTLEEEINMEALRDIGIIAKSGD